ncbi:DCC family protein, chloroplastic [Mucuna pruriens]|uniref:DCC family protein, chloroplastic n=1 Tax=Mucuna pruriens TaxID=157652 RepID=A0A371FII9_MUCPR|nr:DCC family protein, chloroplastic [Mucuna pruriens]
MALQLPPLSGCVGRFNSSACSLRARKVSTFATLSQPRSDWVEATSTFFEQDKRPIMLFDGVCNLCNGGVKFVRDNDRNKTIRYEALQSEAGKMLLRRSGRAPDDISSVVLVEKDRSYIKSEAVLKIMEYIDLPFPQLAILLQFVPLFIRDFVYDNVANNRFRDISQGIVTIEKQENCNYLPEKSSESMAPRRPKSAPDAPTDTVFDASSSKCKIDNKLPPKPESIYKNPILTAKSKRLEFN